MKILFAVMVIVVVLTACGRINERGVKRAMKVCEDHGGFKSISPSMLSASASSSFVCNDGVEYVVYSNQP
jgi:amino acid permease